MIWDHESRWQGYLIAPDSPVLRNKVSANTVEELRDAENDLVEARGLHSCGPDLR
jgi:cell filamentation protein